MSIYALNLWILDERLFDLVEFFITEVLDLDYVMIRVRLKRLSSVFLSFFFLSIMLILSDFMFITYEKILNLMYSTWRESWKFHSNVWFFYSLVISFDWTLFLFTIKRIYWFWLDTRIWVLFIWLNESEFYVSKIVKCLCRSISILCRIRFVWWTITEFWLPDLDFGLKNCGLFQ